MSEKEKGWSATARTALIARLVLYALSIVPAAYGLDGRRLQIGPSAEAAVIAFYRPLFFVVNVSGVIEPFRHYVEWWIALGKSP